MIAGFLFGTEIRGTSEKHFVETWFKFNLNSFLDNTGESASADNGVLAQGGVEDKSQVPALPVSHMYLFIF